VSQSVDINGAMLIKFFSKSRIKWGKFFFLLSISVLINSPDTFSQTKTNLEIFYLLTDSLVHQIVFDIPSNENQILINLNLGESYSIFENQVRTSFKKYGKEVPEHLPNDLYIPHVNIVFEGAGVEYGEMFKDGWFGSHYVQRYEKIYGSYMQSLSESMKKEFEITHLDTVKVEDIKKLENDSFPFTKGKIPSEPFLSGFAEPLIAIGTAAAAVVLFFTIRSK
jgi:hypothetical protein